MLDLFIDPAYALHASADSNSPSTLDAKIFNENIARAFNNPNDGNYLEINLQPKFKAKSGKDPTCIGAEALPRLTINNVNIPPSIFLPRLESSGMISILTNLVLDKTINILDTKPKLQSISVNISPQNLLDHNFSNGLIEKLKISNTDPTRIELEITERTALEDEGAYEHLRILTQAGIKISIDDFGTGEAKFNYLAKYPVSVIKVDMSLVRNFRNAPASWTPLLRAIRAVSNECDVEIIVEGVESEEDILKLQTIGFSIFQGFHFGKAEKPEDFYLNHL